MAKHDDRYNAEAAKSGTRHVVACNDAARACDRVTSAADAALEAAQRKHAETVAKAEADRLAVEQAALAEHGRTMKSALAQWTAVEREALGVPATAFIRKDSLGRFHVHAAPGVPAPAVAHQMGAREWMIDSETGRGFVGGDELVMRRALFAALMAQSTAIEESEAA